MSVWILFLILLKWCFTFVNLDMVAGGRQFPRREGVGPYWNATFKPGMAWSFEIGLLAPGEVLHQEWELPWCLLVNQVVLYPGPPMDQSAYTSSCPWINHHSLPPFWAHKKTRTQQVQTLVGTTLLLRGDTYFGLLSADSLLVTQ